MAEKTYDIKGILNRLGVEDINPGVSTGQNWLEPGGGTTTSYTPIDGSELAKVKNATKEDYEKVIQKAQEAFIEWRDMPAPDRGEIVRQIGLELRASKEDLGMLVSTEMGKSYQEGLGEVQEMIDIADFAVGQSRMLYGYTMQSERPHHRLYDHYHPLGVVGVVTAFNFPVAVYAWNTMIAAVAGDVVIWKPSSKTPLTAVAVQNIVAKVLKNNNVPEGVFNVCIGKSADIGDNMVDDKRVPLISVTGSTAVGRRVAERVGKRLGKCILELGGNNAMILSQHGDIDMAIPTIVFGAVGTAGQRCTTTRRVIVHESIYEDVKKRLLNAYKQVAQKIGNPLNPDNIMGPLIDKGAVEVFTEALKKAKEEGGKIIFGGEVLSGGEYDAGTYVTPAIVEAENHYEIVQEETFAPILYLIKYHDFNEALKLHNDVPQGLSSCIFTLNVREAEKFLSHAGSDCGIANVNVGTSGAEIGGAFGGEKDTGGGRESGSDAWKAYMRQQTTTINYGADLPLAQGIKFEI
ncbi:MAG: aldehyde dehydrogenase family protein [Bacteroidales bacterium]